MNLRISVIIPSYQHASTLNACLTSIFAQTTKPSEVIVVNDGSTDNTTEVLRAWEDRVVVIHQSNQGGNAARNRGFSVSTGELVLFCDADMILDPTMLAKLADALLHTQEAAYAYSGFRFGWKTFRSQPFDAKKLQQENYIHTSALIRREAFLLFDPAIKRFQDWDLWLSMASKGAYGVHVDEVLFRVQTDARRGGISAWRPSVLYHFPWPSWAKPSSVVAYEAARAILYKKHHITAKQKPIQRLSFDRGPLFDRTFWGCLGGVSLLFLLSIATFFHVIPASLVVGFVVAGVAAFTFWKVEYGMSAAFLELFTNSHGHLIDASLGGFVLSLRMAVFIGVFLGYGGRLLAKTSSLPKLYARDGVVLLVLAFALWGGIRGMIGQGVFAAFSDGNAYAYLLYLVPLLSLLRTASEEESGRIMRMWIQMVLVACVYVSVLSLGILYVFTHIPPFWLVKTYAFLRDTRTAEITRLHPSFYRVFLQAQISACLGMLLVVAHLLWKPVGEGRALWRIVLLGACGAAMILSLSRSFWLGSIVALMCLGGAWIWSTRRVFWGQGILRLATRVVPALLLAFGLIGGMILFPWPYQTGSIEGFRSVFASRAADQKDAAVTSRWNLLPPMFAAIGEAPILGSGFGKEITYISDDPRIRAEFPDGVWRTSSVEWGFLEIWLKMGIFGLLAMVLLGAVVVKRLVRLVYTKDGWVAMGLAASTMGLYVIHVFSPYLNHPLGLGILILGYVYAEYGIHSFKNSSLSSV